MPRRTFNSEEERREAQLACKKAYYLRHRDRMLEERRRYNREHPYDKTKARESSWKFQGIKITHEEFLQMAEAQNWCCAICGKHQDDQSKELSVDHCHSTGQVRGLLCGNCNRGIGWLKDDLELLEKAIEYLRKEHETI